MDIQKNEIGSKVVSTVSFSLDQLNLALREVYDLFEYYPYLLLGDTGKGAIDGRLYGDKITIGIEKRYLTKEVRDAIKTHLEYLVDRKYSDYMEISDDLIKYSYNGVPIECKIIHRKYPWFKYPNAIGYNYDDFKVPNPFDKYYKARFIVQ